MEKRAGVECGAGLVSQAFLRQRLVLVEHWLADQDRKFVYAGKGKVRRRTQPSSPNQRDITHELEARSLHKLLASTRKGQVLATLTAWRRQLGKFLMEHRQSNEARRTER
jgi:hypothetical protein